MNPEVLYEALNQMHQTVECELNYTTPFELLVAVELSAQCTDKRVNEVTKKLFKVANTPEAFANMPIEEVEFLIKSCGFYHNKAKHIIEASKSIMQDYGGKVPEKQDELIKLAGVGRKTANVVYAEAFKGDAIAVDTHVFRLSHRLGLSNAKTPEGVEKDLCALFPKEQWSHLHHLLIHHGRYICKAQSPNCESCLIKNKGICHYVGGKNE